MKNFTVSTILTCVLFAAGCDSPTTPSTVSEGKTNISSTVSQTTNTTATNSAAPDAAINSAPTNKNELTTVTKMPTAESLPRKIDDSKAVSPIYQIDSKNCKNLDGQGSEGEDMLRKCLGYGGYSLWIYGEYKTEVYYRIETNSDSDFAAHFSPMMDEEAWKYWQNIEYRQQLAGQMEWILDDKGKPFAVFIHASFYKTKGAKNKADEFVFLRGLEGWKDIDADISTKGAAYDPDEWARKIAYEVHEKKNR